MIPAQHTSSFFSAGRTIEDQVGVGAVLIPDTKDINECLQQLLQLVLLLI